MSISVRTPGAHKVHVTVGKQDICGCATKENTQGDQPTSRCPCGALYIRDTIQRFSNFACYDCHRIVATWQTTHPAMGHSKSC